MADKYGSDFISIVNEEDGTEYELEVLTRVEYNGDSYLAAISAEPEDGVPRIIILKSVEEEGETILLPIEDEQEFEAVDNLIMDQLYSESDSVE